MTRIYKYQLDINSPTTIGLPEGARILSVQMQDENLVMWVMFEGTEHIVENRTFEVFETGLPIYEPWLKYLSTVQVGKYVWHVFERLPQAEEGER